LTKELQSKAGASADIKKIFEQSKDQLTKGASNEVKQFFIAAQQNVLKEDMKYIPQECPCIQTENQVLKKIQQLS